MKRFLLTLLLIASTANAATISFPFSHNFDAISPFSCANYGGTAEIKTDATAPSPSNMLEIDYPIGTYSAEPALCTVTYPTPQDEVWFEFWFKFSSGYQFNAVGDKIVYFRLTNDNGEESSAILYHYGQLAIDTNNPSGASDHLSMSSPAKYSEDGVWKKITGHVVLNTATSGSFSANGVQQLWLDDELVINKSNIVYRTNTNYTSKFKNFRITPVWGGVASRKNQVDYIYFDSVRIQTTAFGASTDTTVPHLSTFSPANGSTGVPAATTSFSFHALDSGTGYSGVSSSTISVNCAGVGGVKTCASGLTCSGTSADYTVTYGSLSLTTEQTVSCTINASDVAGNVMAQQAYSFITAAPAPVPVAISTTSLAQGQVGTAYSATAVASGGQSPYTWSVVSGALPAGLTLSSGGVLSGLPTASGTSSFTLRATDVLAATDDQTLSILVQPAPVIQQAIAESATFADTYINSGSAGTNYGSDNTMEIYQWPIGTVANRIIVKDNTSVAAIPAGKTIDSAKLRLWLTGKEGSGGTNPMRCHVRSISGTVPDTTTVTWANFAGTLGDDISVTDVGLTVGWYELDVLSAVQAAYVSGDPLYFAIDGGGDGTSDTNRIFSSSEGSYPPQLVITHHTTAVDNVNISVPPPNPAPIDNTNTGITPGQTYPVSTTCLTQYTNCLRGGGNYSLPSVLKNYLRSP